MRVKWGRTDFRKLQPGLCFRHRSVVARRSGQARGVALHLLSLLEGERSQTAGCPSRPCPGAGKPRAHHLTAGCLLSVHSPVTFGKKSKHKP